MSTSHTGRPYLRLPNGKIFAADIVVAHMDADIREALSNDWDEDRGGEQEFLDEYCELHLQNFNEEFQIN